LFNDLKAFAFNYLRRVRSEHLSRQLDKQQPAQDNSCLAPIFLKSEPTPSAPKNPLGARSCHWPTFGHTNFGAQRGARFFGATTNFRLSFIFIEAQSLFSIGAKGVGKGLLKVEFFDCVLMRSGNLAANSLFE
jgi:hypothetical protein